ncbi:MAG TPA: flagellar biosynthesis protein FliQ [Planctomycetaceae bacterium]|nr:flagellar biosynthesis protein FliQ [Planctomycetaceae bacterium]
MTIDAAVDLVRQATFLGLLIAAPVLAVSIVVGLVVGILQAATQLQEQTLNFIPRLVLVLVTILVVLPWSIERLVDYSTTLYREIPATF